MQVLRPSLQPWRLLIATVFILGGGLARAGDLEPVDVEGQPLAANVQRLLQALDYLGAPLPAQIQASVLAAAEARDSRKLQQALDHLVLLAVSINPESRVKVARGPAKVTLQQGGFTPVPVKVVNEGGVTKALRLTSPQAGPPYAGVAKLSMTRQDQLHLLDNPNEKPSRDRFLQLEMFSRQPLTEQLSGLKVEYALALIYSSEAGRREATLGFHVGQGTQDLGFRGEVPILFDIRPAVPVRLSVRDVDGKPTTGRFTFRDAADHIYPPQPGRLAPDLFFQQQVYRRDGDSILLPPGQLKMYYSRGPEYRLLARPITVPAEGKPEIAVRLERWIDPAALGDDFFPYHRPAADSQPLAAPAKHPGRRLFIHLLAEHRP